MDLSESRSNLCLRLGSVHMTLCRPSSQVAPPFSKDTNFGGPMVLTVPSTNLSRKPQLLNRNHSCHTPAQHPATDPLSCSTALKKGRPTVKFEKRRGGEDCDGRLAGTTNADKGAAVLNVPVLIGPDSEQYSPHISAISCPS
jgi:hypothetical protein